MHTHFLRGSAYIGTVSNSLSSSSMMDTSHDPNANYSKTDTDPHNDSSFSLYNSSFPSHKGGCFSSSTTTKSARSTTVTPPPPPPPSSSTSSISTSISTSTFHSQLGISDSEMIALQSVTYTSLKDILPSSPPSTASPTTHNSSWQDNEIPIRNPLVKHAALAYLQPMSTPPEVGSKGFFGKFNEICLCQCECFSWLNDVVLRMCGVIVDDNDDDDDDFKKKLTE